MTQVSLHAMPRGRDVVREQIRIVGLALRREALVVAIVVGIVTAKIVIDIVRGSAASWFDSDEWVPIAFVSFFVPFAIWRREKRFGPAFLWTLPVDRRRLALARVFAGWVWLMAALAFFVCWQAGLALVSRVAGAETVNLFAFVGATAMYLFGSALVLGLRHPLRWLLGTAGVFFLLGFFNQAVDIRMRSGAVGSAINSAGTFWLALSEPVQWVVAAFLWLGAGLIALWAALSRHGERRRH